jgi:hypothetical protein
MKIRIKINLYFDFFDLKSKFILILLNQKQFVFNLVFVYKQSNHTNVDTFDRF